MASERIRWSVTRPSSELIDEGESEFTEYAVDNFDRIDLYDDLYASGFNPVSLSYND